MNDKSKAREWTLALAGCQLMQGDCKGPRPTLVEIELWRNGGVEGERAEQVLSHIAHNDDCFVQWRDLCEEQRWLDLQSVDDQPRSDALKATDAAKHWLTNTVARIATPAWGSAIAAGLFALLLLPSVFMSNDQNIQRTYGQQLDLASHMNGAEFPAVLGRMTKSIQALDGQATHQDKYQFQLGLAATAERIKVADMASWKGWLDALPAAIECSNLGTSACSSTGILNQALGSWSLVTALACNSNTVGNEFWAEQANALSLLVDKKLPRTHFLASRLRGPLPKSQADLCIMANGLLGQGA